jgi:hypothetical protein
VDVAAMLTLGLVSHKPRLQRAFPDASHGAEASLQQLARKGEESG